MQKPGKLFLGVVTLWPLAYMILFFVFIFSTILFGGPGGSPGAFPPSFVIIFGLHLLTMLVIMGLTIFYMVDVFRNDRVDKDKKVLWAIVIFMGNLIAMPIYWYLYFWKEPALTGKPSFGQLNSASPWTNNVNSSTQGQREYVPPREPPNWRE
jgi:hypothetical protein